MGYKQKNRFYYYKLKIKIMKFKLVLFFLAALLAIIIFKMIFLGVFLFIHLVKYLAIAAGIAYVAYWLDKNSKKSE